MINPSTIQSVGIYSLAGTGVFFLSALAFTLIKDKKGKGQLADQVDNRSFEEKYTRRFGRLGSGLLIAATVILIAGLLGIGVWAMTITDKYYAYTAVPNSSFVSSETFAARVGCAIPTAFAGALVLVGCILLYYKPTREVGA